MVFYLAEIGLGLSIAPVNRLTSPASFSGSAKRFIASAAIISSFHAPGAVIASDYSATQINAVDQIIRVQRSLSYIDETINKEGNPAAVVSQINLLLKNYKLKDNLRLSLDLIESSSKREDARVHGLSAIEDLQIVSEYFDDDINDTTGLKTPPRAVLQLALQATEAANKEFSELLRLFPSEIISSSKEKVTQEFQ